MADAWTAAVWNHFTAGNLTPLFRDVLLRLQKFVGELGCFPAQDTLAKSARCSRTTVGAALKQGRALGLVSWVSGAAKRTSNRYSLIVPKVAVVAVRLVRGMRAASQQPRRSARGQAQGPVRSVAQQLAAIAGWVRQEADRKEGSVRKGLFADGIENNEAVGGNPAISATDAVIVPSNLQKARCRI